MPIAHRVASPPLCPALPSFAAPKKHWQAFAFDLLASDGYPATEKAGVSAQREAFFYLLRQAARGALFGEALGPHPREKEDGWCRRAPAPLGGVIYGRRGGGGEGGGPAGLRKRARGGGGVALSLSPSGGGAGRPRPGTRAAALAGTDSDSEGDAGAAGRWDGGDADGGFLASPHGGLLLGGHLASVLCRDLAARVAYQRSPSCPALACDCLALPAIQGSLLHRLVEDVTYTTQEARALAAALYTLVTTTGPARAAARPVASQLLGSLADLLSMREKGSSSSGGAGAGAGGRTRGLCGGRNLRTELDANLLALMLSPHGQWAAKSDANDFGLLDSGEKVMLTKAMESFEWASQGEEPKGAKGKAKGKAKAKGKEGMEAEKAVKVETVEVDVGLGQAGHEL